MNASTKVDVYELTGADLELRLRLSAGTLDVRGGGLLTREDMAVEVSTDPGIGVHVIAIVLPSSRNGTRVTLSLLVPEVSGEGPVDVTGVATVVESFHQRMGTPPRVLQDFAEPQLLTSTAS